MDPRTALILITLFALLNGGILGFMHRGLSTKLRPSAKDWRIGTLMASGGTVLLAAQSPESAWLVLPSGNAFILVGFALYWRSVRRFDAVPDSYALFVPALLCSLALIWFTVVQPILWVRVGITCIGWAFAMLGSAYSLRTHRPQRREVSRNALIVIFLLLTAFMVFRAVFFALKMREVDSILAPNNWLNMLTPLSASILPVIGTTAFLVMCSERLRGELALRAIELDQKNAALRSAIRAREDAERIARHDLKTPLASIAATPELLRAVRQPEPEQEQLLRMIENAARRALSMVNLSLDLYAMENGSYQFHPERVDLNALTQTVIEDLRVHAQAKHVELNLNNHKKLDAVWVAANPSLCYSCIANLLKNAVEAATENSQVRLQLDTGGLVSLRIHNNTAVPLALRERFFEKYATENKLGGTGLGTYSSYVMATVQGGRLQMQTSDEMGTSLTLELPAYGETKLASTEEKNQQDVDWDAAQPSNSEEDTSKPAGAKRAVKVLLVDDDAYNSKVLSVQFNALQLSAFEIQLNTVVNGRYAWEQALQQDFNLIFMDIEMPVMDGIAATRHIRELQHARRQTPSYIIAFTSDDNVVSQARFLALGFDLCMSKPAEITQLQRLFTQLTSNTCDVQEHGREPKSQPRQSLPVQLHVKLLPEIAGFIASRFTLIEQLSEASLAADHVSVRSLAHQLHGSLAMYGFDYAASLCQQIESQQMNTFEFDLALQELSAELRDAPIQLVD